MSDKNKQKCGFVSIIGAPNAGKSTLLNRIIGSKISIVTPKVQTTRNRITGILTEGDTQLVFVDTPGIFRPRHRLDKAMVKAAWDSLEDMDFTALIVDARKGICNDTSDILNGLKDRAGKKILLLNKIDLIDKKKLLDLSQSINDKVDFDQTFMISATKGNGVDDFIGYLKKNFKEGPFMYPADQASDIPMRLFAAEITREKLMFKLEQELPYKLMVETEKWEEGSKGIKIDQVIYVDSESHKKIIVGKGGKTIKDIGEKARKELSYLMDTKVHLFLFVKVKKDWQDRYNPSG